MAAIAKHDEPRCLPTFTQNDLISHLLITLNNAAPPYLSSDALATCFQETIRPTSLPLTFLHLAAARERLAESILKCKKAIVEQGCAPPHVYISEDQMMTTAPTLDQFLGEISRILREKNAVQLQDYLVIEPPYRDLYNAMITEIRHVFPKGSEGTLEVKCSAALPEARNGEDGAPWTAFSTFMVQYLGFLRDVNIANLLDTYNLLSELVQKCNSALSHPSLGTLILPATVSYSHMLSRLAIGLDKKPELIAHLVKHSTDESGVRETLPERAANIIRQAFVTCLNDRASGVRETLPEGKKVGIYKLANLCLKVLFQCRKTRNAEQIFVNIYNQAPSLSLYPRSERVTYLYYLGRFLFANNHFFRSLSTLQEAYSQCHLKCTKQRRLILIYLLASNIILGRLPSPRVYERPEATGLAEVFQPICRSIATGNLASFRKVMDFDSPNAPWLIRHRVLLQMRNRCEVLVWRSLARKTFLVAGAQGNANEKKAPTFNLNDMLLLVRAMEKRASIRNPTTHANGKPGSRHTNWIFMTDNETGAIDRYVDPDLEGEKPESLLPDMLEIESMLSSLVDQGFLNGFISHRQLRFAIVGAKKKGALAAGFPNIWEVIRARSDDEVPGWKKEVTSSRVNDLSQRQQRYGPGMVVNLTGARPAGSAP